MKVAAKDSPIGVKLVQNDPPQLAQKRLPGVPGAENPQMKHVRVRDHDARKRALDPRAVPLRRIAVVDRAQSRATVETGRPSQELELATLVLSQCAVGVVTRVLRPCLAAARPAA